MRRFVRVVDRITDACAVAAAGFLIAALLIVVWMVIWRATGHSTYWEIELATYLIVGTVLVGSPYCLRTRGHIGVDLLSAWLPARYHVALERVLAVLGVAVCLYLAWKGWELTFDAWQKNEGSGSTWNPPRWPFFALMPLGLGLTALQYLAEMARESPDEVPQDPAMPKGQGV